MTTPTAYRMVVDGIEEDTARVEVDGATILSLPLWMLPDRVREGQTLRATRSASPGSVTLTISVDAQSARAALDTSARQVGKLKKAARKRDTGGDVAL